uniref:28S ribosomal protein S18c, mitochondrial-like n=1 Tax=Nyctereutes procyonoides TaxID=34880 RepID=UPI002443EA00|nr:28S ribosomal protein S18c, mitochondrial-like [Nyctereutes procyonoides]
MERRKGERRGEHSKPSGRQFYRVEFLKILCVIDTFENLRKALEHYCDYKRVQLLSQFISLFTGCIYGKHITSLWEETEGIIKAIKRAQIMGFVPVTYKDSTYLKEHKSCNIKYQE